jgi:hypothetical protein
MAKHCLISEKIVRRSLKVLLGSKLIAVAASVPGKSVVYEITPREEWCDPSKLPGLREKHTTTTPGKSATTTPGKSATTTPGKSATTTPGKSATTPLANLPDEVFTSKGIPSKVIPPNPQGNSREEVDTGNPNTQDPSPQISASLITKAESSQPTDNSTVETIIPSPRFASSHNKADEHFTTPREFNSAKGTYKSASSDPWMASAHNPDKCFSEWVFSKRYKDKPSATLADAKAEIRNSWERASDLWDEYQSELLKKQQRIEVVVHMETEKPYKPQNTGHRMTEEARNAFKQKLAAK